MFIVKKKICWTEVIKESREVVVLKNTRSATYPTKRFSVLNCLRPSEQVMNKTENQMGTLASRYSI